MFSSLGCCSWPQHRTLLLKKYFIKIPYFSAVLLGVIPNDDHFLKDKK
jgi:hypothetical protein